MDTNGTNSSNNYDKFVKENKVMNIADLEEKQLAGKIENNNQIQKEISKEDMLKKESFKSENDFELDDMKGIKDTVSEGSAKESGSKKSIMKVDSKAFTPKISKKVESTKSIEEFEISGGNTLKESVNKKIVKKESWKLKYSSNTRSYVPKQKSGPSTITQEPPPTTQVHSLATQAPPATIQLSPPIIQLPPPATQLPRATQLHHINNTAPQTNRLQVNPILSQTVNPSTFQPKGKYLLLYKIIFSSLNHKFILGQFPSTQQIQKTFYPSKR